MIGLALISLLQATSAPAPQDGEAVSTQAAQTDVGQAAQKVVCTMEPITGTRAKKQKVCKTPGYEKGSERYREMLGAIQRASNVQPGEPPAQGVRPGGPGY